MMQTHYDVMNNKANFGGDIDDIEEMSEFVDDNSKFVYTSDEEDEQRSPQQVYPEGIAQSLYTIYLLMFR